MSGPVLASRDGGILTLTLNRPERRNALDAASYFALAEALRAAHDDLDVGAVVLTGAGGHFTAGNDLRDFQAGRPAGDSPGLQFLRALVDCDAPVVAAVEGHAIGIGVTLLQHCDFVYAGRDAALRLPFLALGLCPEGGSSQVLARMAGARRAAEWLLLGDAFGADAAREAGLVSQVTEPGQALAHAQATAARLAAQPRQALRVSKALMRGPQRPALHATLDREAEQFGQRLASAEAQAAFARFFAPREA
ncbi:enoyl-CoA hydratase-related protein [Bordetella hinzii]|uniref:Enoyl-CoA hydratase n=2 Tax=Bordetella hinzii TaxID=103855 RepID=A0AAN1RXD8_9BORD|nr:enoyl-CoA hydratase-related protein [Bordetella hinzii]AKQ62050.1 2,3-dehydroadipyl-CoA hydratase [Bordetella hinzii]AZW17032.1 enoyl-CoA hydratase [Bordetella hinzii]KCB22972.1 enoyl-CoA hydratase/isomerase family protein [Bordetella hinzii OH87 BAL007II]KCB31980.1 enoyl-CoA hydratase/isomerase family protein [Bordetella hinzii CA90 BAL1384]KCB45800.1 enoyl-CoA hydratase/isomerase family protein [Bordetella hinzii 5132]